MIDLPDLPDYGKNQPSFSGTLKGADKQPAPKPEPAPTSPDTPYPGLRPYREDEQNKFFGRDADCRVLIDKILVNRLTLLFAATGVGKSSLLQAAVLPHLKSPHGENLDVVYYNDWISPPLDNLKQAVMRELKYSGSWQQEVVYTPSDPDNEKLGDFLGFCSFFTRQPLIVVLDQFEEFFRYQKGRALFEPFLQQLTGVFSNNTLPVHLVFSMREDFALELDAFKKFVPLSVFNNLYRLDKLGKAAAQEAILAPLKPTGFRYEPELQAQLLQDLLSRDLKRDANSPLADMTESVDPPYLQIVCSQLWEREAANPDKILRMKTYQAAGGAAGLLENYIRNTLQGFSEKDKVLASRAFDHLISRHGAKMPYTPEDLAAATGANFGKLNAVLEKLAKARILRSQKRVDKIWYELYHDMFSASIEGWNTKQKEKMRNKRLLIIGGSAAIALFVVTFGTIWGFNHFNHHLRLSVLEGSHVEVYQGKKGWPDPFGQQQYAYETLLSERDMEVDKRFNEQGILDYGDLTNELTGYRPFAERIHGYIEHGNFSEVVKLKNKAFKDTSSNPKISRDVIRGLFGLKTETGFDLIKRPAREDKPSSLSDTDLTLLQENTLLFPLDELTPFPFFYNQLKQQGIGSVSASDPRIIDKLTHYLSDKNTNVRQYAAFALGQIGDPSAIPALANALKDKDENESMRSSAASALGNIGDTSASTALANALNNKDENEDVRSSAASALGRIGDTSAISVLANALNNKDENEDVRSSAASALGNIGDTSAISALANALKNENESVRSSAASALGNIGDPSAISVLANALNNKDENEDVRRAAASALGNIGDTSASSALANVFKDKDENEGVRSSAASALGNIGDTSTIPALAAALKNKDENESVRSSAASALGLIGDTSASTALANALKDENESVRSYAASALGLIGTPSASSALANALKDENESVRRDAASALGLIGDPSAISALANALKDESESVRRYAAEALGKIGSPHQIQVDEITQKEGAFKWADFFPGGYGEERKLSEIMGSVNDRRALLQALNLPVSPERNQQLLTLAQKTNAHISIRQKAIETLADSKDANLVASLQPLKSHPQLNKTITELENKVLPPLDIMHDSSRKLSARLAAFKRLAKDDPTTAKQEILRIIRQPEEDAFSNLAYRLLGDLQITDNGVIPLLQERLEALDGQFRDWRKLRDSKPLSGLTTEAQDDVVKELRQAKDAIKNQQFAFDYAYALARLDPDIGSELLTHNLADVRQGAYTGFAMQANIKWLKKLDQAREARRDDPVFHHTAYRAIDMGLSRLEILGNNPRDGAKDKELKELWAWQQELESAPPRITADDPDDEVLERLQWTTRMMKHYNKLDQEFREKYGKKRVWPEDTLPVNRPLS